MTLANDQRAQLEALYAEFDQCGAEAARLSAAHICSFLRVHADLPGRRVFTGCPRCPAVRLHR